MDSSDCRIKVDANKTYLLIFYPKTWRIASVLEHTNVKNGGLGPKIRPCFLVFWACLFQAGGSLPDTPSFSCPKRKRKGPAVPMRRPPAGAAAPAGVHRLETVAVFRFLFDVKKEQHIGRLPSAIQASSNARRSVAASSACVPADSQIIVGHNPRCFSSFIRGSWGGPYWVSAKVRCIFSPPSV